MQNLSRYKEQVKIMINIVSADPQLKKIYRDVNFNRILYDIEDRERSYSEPFHDLTSTDKDMVKQLFGC